MVVEVARQSPSSTSAQLAALAKRAVAAVGRGGAGRRVGALRLRALTAAALGANVQLPLAELLQVGIDLEGKVYRGVGRAGG